MVQTGVPRSVWPLGFLEPAWPPLQLLSLGSLEPDCVPLKLTSSEVVNLTFLDLSSPLVKSKISSKVVGQDIGPIVGMQSRVAG